MESSKNGKALSNFLESVMKVRKTTSINRLKKIDDGALVMVSSSSKGTTFQDASAQVACWPNSRKLDFVFVERRLPLLGVSKVVLASLI